jgi:hypothetical protein
MKMGRIREKYDFHDATQTMHRWSRSLEIISGTKNCVLAHKNWQKTLKRRVLVTPLKPSIGGHDRWKFILRTKCCAL